MAFIKNQLRLTFQFVIDGLDEVGETSLHISTLGSGSFDAVGALAALTTTQMQTLLADMHTLISGNAGSPWASYSKLASLKAAAVDVNGHYLTDPKVHDSTTTFKGTTSTSVPAQCSIVLSLRSGSNIGVANYGRMFLPHIQWAQIDASPYAAQADVNALVAKAATFIGQVNVIADTLVATSGVVLMSAKDAAQPKGVARVALYPLTETQRRRMHQIPASYTFANV